jgi:hypothetical protein
MQFDQMKRREFLTLLGGAAAAWPLAAHAQQSELTRRLGVLMPFEAQDSFGREIMSALREGLRERGWADGRNIRIDERWIGGDDERRSTYAAELVRSSPDVIFACFAGQLVDCCVKHERSQSFSWESQTRSPPAMSRALRVRAATSPGSFFSSRRWSANGWAS